MSDASFLQPNLDPLTPTVGARLIVYIDFKSPYAFVAYAPTYALAASLGVTIDWRPFVLDIPSYLGSARLDAQGKVAESNRSASQWSSVRYAYMDARRYAALQGNTLRGTTKIWNSSLAGCGMLWARRAGTAPLHRYCSLVFERFWRRELDIEDAAVITAMVREAGAPTQGLPAFLAEDGPALMAEQQPRFFAAGIFGVPTYIVDDEIYFGREHLPRIRWQLSGRHGPAPDVAYVTLDSPSP